MKITEWAILFVLLTGPLFWAASVRADNRMEVLLLEQRYNAVLKTAVQDGASQLNLNEQPVYEAGYNSDKQFRVDKQSGLDALLHTLFLNFNLADDPAGQRAFMMYIPAVVVMDYDGYWIYGIQEAVNQDGTEERVSTWFPKKPYVYTDSSGSVLAFTLDQQLSYLDTNRKQFLKGRLADLSQGASDPLIAESEKVEAIRRTAIVTSIEEDLEQRIAAHNRFAELAGVNYTFTLPQIPDEEWTNTIDDAGILVFLQGIPVGDQYYNNFAFSGGRLVRHEPVWGGVDTRTGIKYFYEEACAGQYRTEETFSSERDAAAKGYFEARCTKLPSS
ncbi:hypothetical protein [Paenibacillus pinistramenti]|uniref:hypothetical protein n=1 Tax=Paenibacillus pinistramenti TaxID=1768003 RepID=UPI001108297C|nr:hypothetical protein [Paenibacillus pinistramenti]